MILPTEIEGEREREEREACSGEGGGGPEVLLYYCDYYLTSCYGVVWIHTTYRSTGHGPRPRHVGSQRTAATA